MNQNTILENSVKSYDENNNNNNLLIDEDELIKVSILKTNDNAESIESLLELFSSLMEFEGLEIIKEINIKSDLLKGNFKDYLKMNLHYVEKRMKP